MTDLPYWGITAVLFWIRTRDFSYVQQLLTGDAKRDEDYSYYCFMIGEFQSPEGREKRPLVVSKEQAAAELHAKVRFGELKVAGIKCDPRNKGEPVSDTVQDIPARDWGNLGFSLCSDDSYAAFYENNRYPSWRHMVCLSVTVRQLWPQDQAETAEAVQASQSMPAPARKRPVSQQSVAEKVGREIFPYGVPASMTTRQISAAIAQKLKTDHPPLAKEISRTTLARAARSLPKASV